ncbi:MAG TPA: carbohydrate binding family 9 domain-containing protein, partial [Longimicrobium sp.]|nr:carbohydrate binding family 9 domain-containing protein [Longimicrobium sp.]
MSLLRFSAAAAFSALLLNAAPAPAQTPAPAATRAPATLQATRLQGEVRVDGRLDEAGWAAAPAADQFMQSYPDVGAAPTMRTEARVLYDDENLYVGVRMFDPAPDSIAAPLARRDAAGIYSEWLHVIVDSRHDRRSAFRFSTNPRALQRDVYTYDDGEEDGSWDAVWDVAATVDSLGWVAEYRIPMS